MSRPKPTLEFCFACGTELRSGLRKCINKKCGVWNFTGSIASPESKVKTLEEHTVLLSDAKLSVIKRVQTGLVDKLFGGGIAHKSLNMIGGDPGAGKTTLCLQLASSVLDQFPDREALYIANEQDPDELRETAVRLNVQHLNRIRIVKAMGGIVFDIGEMLLHYKPILTFLDSITQWIGDDLSAAVPICQRLKHYMVHLDAMGIIICQVNKGGGFAGLKKVEHVVDMTAMFEVLVDEGRVPTPEDPRELRSQKNRKGPAPVAQYFKFSKLGFLEEITEEEAYE